MKDRGFLYELRAYLIYVKVGEKGVPYPSGRSRGRWEREEAYFIQGTGYERRSSFLPFPEWKNGSHFLLGWHRVFRSLVDPSRNSNPWLFAPELSYSEHSTTAPIVCSLGFVIINAY